MNTGGYWYRSPKGLPCWVVLVVSIGVLFAHSPAWAQSLSLARDQVFIVGDVLGDAVSMTVTAGEEGISAVYDIRIVIPNSLAMDWDTEIRSIQIEGTGTNKVSPDVQYTGVDTLMVSMVDSLTGGETVVLSGLRFRNFSSVSWPTPLVLLVNGPGAPEVPSEGRVRIGKPEISSLGDRGYVEEDPAWDIGQVVIREDTVAAGITAEGDIRVIIPPGLSMDWQVQDTEATFSGGAAGKVEKTVRYEGLDTLVVDVIEDFAPGDSLVIGRLSFRGFEIPSRDTLGLSVTGGRTLNARDRYETVVWEAPGLSLGGDWAYVLSDSVGPLALLKLWERSEGSVLGKVREEVWIQIPEESPVYWDEGVKTVQVTPEDRIEKEVGYADSRTVVFQVGQAFARGDTVYVKGLRFRLEGECSPRRLGLSVSGGLSVNYLGEGSIRVGQPYMYSEVGDQTFVVGGRGVAMSPLVIGEGDSAGVMGARHGIRVRIPEHAGLEWDTTDVEVEIGGEDTTVAKVSDRVWYVDAKTLVLDFREGVEGFHSSEQIVVSGLSFRNFSTVSSGRLGLDVSGYGDLDAEDPGWLLVGDPKVRLKASQVFVVGDPETELLPVEIVEDSVAVIRAEGDIRLVVSDGLEADWGDVSGLEVEGSAASKVDVGNVRVEGVDTLVVEVVEDFAPGDNLILRHLSLQNFQKASLPTPLMLFIDPLYSRRVQSEETIRIGAPILTSAFDQVFAVGDPSTEVASIRIRESDIAAGITADRDMRIIIPEGLALEWDRTVTEPSMSGSAFDSAKVSTMVTYLEGEDGRQDTLIVDVVKDFAVSDSLVLSGLRFTNFQRVSPPERLRLSVNGGRGVNASDDKTIQIGQPLVYFRENQTFVEWDSVAVAGDSVGYALPLVIREQEVPCILPGRDIRVVIPPELGMNWDDTMDTPVLSGSAAKRVSETEPVSYAMGPPGVDTLIVRVQEAFAANDSLVLSGLRFVRLSASPKDYITLSVNGGRSINAVDSHWIRVGNPSMASLAQQLVPFGEAIPLAPIRIREEPVAGSITAEEDIRIVIPDTLNIGWDSTIEAIDVKGSASTKLSGEVRYAGRDTLIAEVLEDFGPSDEVIVSGMQVMASDRRFTRGHLILSVNGGVDAIDEEEIIKGAPSMASEYDQRFVINDPVTEAAPIVIRDHEAVAFIKEGREIRIIIPDSLHLDWDTEVVEVQVTAFGIGALDAQVRYSGVDTLIVAVTSDFAPGDSVKIERLRFTNFSEASPPSRLGLSISGRAVNAFDERTIQIGAPYVRTTRDLSFVVRDSATSIGVVQIREHSAAASIAADNDIRIVIPEGLHAEWDTTVRNVFVTGTAAERINPEDPVRYPDPKTAEIQVEEDFAPSEYIYLAGLKMRNFSVISPKDTLGLSVNDERTVNGKDVHSIRIGDPVLEFEKDQVFVPGGERVLDTLRVREALEVGSVTAGEDVRIWIPSGIGLMFDERTVGGIQLRGSAVDSGKVGKVSVRRDGEELHVDVLEDFVGEDWLEISGAGMSFSGPVRQSRLQLSVNGGVDRESRVDRGREGTTVRVGWPQIYSPGDREYVEGDPVWDIEQIVIREDTTAAGITKEGDIRVIIPSGLSMDWQVQDTVATVSGSAWGKVNTVRYEGPDTLVVDVVEDFAPGDSLVIGGLSFRGFKTESRDTLRLSVTGGRTLNAMDRYETAVWEAPGLSLEEDWAYVRSDTLGPLPRLRIWERSAGSVLGRVRQEVWIRIPEESPVYWDTVGVKLDTVRVIPEGQISPVRYADSRTVVFRIGQPFARGDAVYVEGLRFRLEGECSARRLGVSVSRGLSVNRLGEGSIRVGQPYMYSVNDQPFVVDTLVVGGMRVAMVPLVISEGDSTGVIGARYGIRVKIPEYVGLEWDTVKAEIHVGGTAKNKVVSKARFEDTRTLVVDVVEDFGASDSITLSGLWFRNFSKVSSGKLGLDVSRYGALDAVDPRWLLVGNPKLRLGVSGDSEVLRPGVSQVFVVGDPETALSWIKIVEDSVAVIRADTDIRLVLPEGLEADWVDSLSVEGSATAKVKRTVKVMGGDTLLVDVVNDFAPEDTLILHHLSLKDFRQASSDEKLGLSVDIDRLGVHTWSDRTLRIAAPRLRSDDAQSFVVDDPPTAAVPISIFEDPSDHTIFPSKGIRIVIPDTLHMDWQLLSYPDITGSGASKVDSIYLKGPDTLFVAVNDTFSLGGMLRIAARDTTELRLKDFKAVSIRATLGLSVNGGRSINVADSLTKRIGRPTLSMEKEAVFVEGTIPDFSIPPRAMPLVTIREHKKEAAIRKGDVIQIVIPDSVGLDWAIDAASVKDSLKGSAATNVKVQEPKGHILAMDVTKDFAPGDSLILSGLYVGNFRLSRRDSLRLWLNASEHGGLHREIDQSHNIDLPDSTATVRVGRPTLSSGENQSFVFGDEATEAWPIVIMEDSLEAGITAGLDIRVVIPQGLHMRWDNSVKETHIEGTAKGRIDSIAYAPEDTALIVYVGEDFEPSEYIILSPPGTPDEKRLRFQDFSGKSDTTLVLYVCPYPSAADSFRKRIGAPSIGSSEEYQVFIVKDPPVEADPITIREDEEVTTIMASRDIRIIIPDSLDMEWDIGQDSVMVTGSAADSVGSKVFFGDSKTLVVDVIGDFAPSDSITLSGLRFQNFKGVSKGHLGLVVTRLNSELGRALPDPAEKKIGRPVVRSELSSFFPLDSDSLKMLPTIRVQEDSVAVITDHIKLVIPDTLGQFLSWDGFSPLRCTPPDIIKPGNWRISEDTVEAWVERPLEPYESVVFDSLRFTIRRTYDRLPKKYDHSTAKDTLANHLPEDGRLGLVVHDSAQRRAEFSDTLVVAEDDQPIELYLPVLFDPPRMFTLNDTPYLALDLSPGGGYGELSALRPQQFQIFKNSRTTSDTLFTEGSEPLVGTRKLNLGFEVPEIKFKLTDPLVKKINRWFDDNWLDRQENADLPADTLNVWVRPRYGVERNVRRAADRRYVDFLGLIAPEQVAFPLLPVDVGVFNPRYFHPKPEGGSNRTSRLDSLDLKIEGLDLSASGWVINALGDTVASVLGASRRGLDLGTVDEAGRLSNPLPDGTYLVFAYTRRSGEQDVLSFPVVRQFIIDSHPPQIAQSVDGTLVFPGEDTVNVFFPIPGLDLGKGFAVTPDDTLRTKILDHQRLPGTGLWSAEKMGDSLWVARDDNIVIHERLYFRFPKLEYPVRLAFRADLPDTVDANSLRDTLEARKGAIAEAMGLREEDVLVRDPVDSLSHGKKRVTLSIWFALSPDLLAKQPSNFSFPLKLLPEDMLQNGQELLIRLEVLDVAGSRDVVKVNCPLTDIRYVVHTWEVEGLLVDRVINFPNPFSSLPSVSEESQTTIRYVLTRGASRGTLRIFNAAGELVYYRTLDGTLLTAGEHLIRWNGRSLYGYALASGVYFGILEVGGEDERDWGKWKVAISNH